MALGLQGDAACLEPVLRARRSGAWTIEIQRSGEESGSGSGLALELARWERRI